MMKYIWGDLSSPQKKANNVSLAVFASLFLVCLTTPVQASERPHSSHHHGERNYPVSLFGSYLAGRVAQGNRDIKNASHFFRSALQRDPGNKALILQSLVLDVSAGEWDGVEERAQTVLKQNKNQHVASLVLGIEAFNRGEFQKARKFFADSGKSPISLLISVLAEAWAYKAEGQSELAILTLKKLNRLNWSRFYQSYHKALIYDTSGSRKRAEREYKKLFAQEARSLRLALAYVQHLSSRRKNKSATRILNKHLKVSNLHPLAEALGETLEARKYAKKFILNAQEGLAEVFFGVGDALTSEGGVDIGTMYLQMALRLRPEFPMAQLALAEVFEDAKHYRLSNQAYGQIGEDSPLWASVVIRKAFNLNAEKRVDEAKRLLDHVLEQEPDNLNALEALGNILRSHKRFKEAIKYYTKIISKIENEESDDWKYYYSRGVSYERLKNWPMAEKDLETALRLNPNEPLVLNYLGYSWVDQGLRLKTAMKLIRKAVNEKPNDAYFVDSLGWAHYRLGDFKKATGYLEKAVGLRADDPIINDHLGDAYWRVGRKLEAKFQWKQSLDLKAEPEEAKKIREKLKVGLDKVEKKKVANLATVSGKISDAIKSVPANKSSEPAKAANEKKPVVDENVVSTTPTATNSDEIYTVVPGDTLWKISKKLYGNGRKYRKILKENRDILGRRGHVLPGMKLRIPKL